MIEFRKPYYELTDDELEGFLLANSLQFNEILKYCEPHLDHMWAAYIASIILKCDFRDVKQELKKRIPIPTNSVSGSEDIGPGVER